ncbi:MAG TPA: DUF2949 domain-containing protein [Leptolyngbyaceae cyanobacterium M65_K2018_010]|nr:DUF2949 domain-containing protein [Leptolyngbyaceae cyanobacterium M65_K2018_010]
MTQHDCLIEFLQGNLEIAPESIAMGLRQSQETPSLLPMILYQYGFVTSHELAQIFDWLEATQAKENNPRIAMDL